MKKALAFLMTLAVLSSYAMAANLDFYGSIRQDFGKDDTTTFLNDDDSRVGAKVSDGNISGHLELAVNGATTAEPNGVKLRLLYATWKMEDITLTVGHAWRPDNFLIDTSVLEGGANSKADLFIGRDNLFMVSMAGAKVALVEPATTASNLIPEIVFSYGLNAGVADVTFAGNFDSKAETWLVGACASKKMDAMSVAGQLNLTNTTGYMHAGVVGGYQVASNMKVTGGFSYTKADDATDAKYSYYVNLPISMSGLIITPEVGVGETEKLWMGVQAKLDF